MNSVIARGVSTRGRTWMARMDTVIPPFDRQAFQNSTARPYLPLAGSPICSTEGASIASSVLPCCHSVHSSKNTEVTSVVPAIHQRVFSESILIFGGIRDWRSLGREISGLSHRSATGEWPIGASSSKRGPAGLCGPYGVKGPSRRGGQAADARRTRFHGR